MELTINREDLFTGLLKTQNMIEKRSTMPILSNVLLEAKNDTLRIKATDLEIGVDTVHPADVKKDGSLTVPGKKLFEMVREMETGELRLSKKAVCRMIEKTIYAVSTDEIRYTLNGIFIEKKDDVLRMVATDGHRLSLMNFIDPSLKDIDIGKGVIIPRKGASELKKLLEDGDDDLMVNIKDNNGVFKKGNTLLSIRMIDGEVPAYKQVIPAKGEREARVNKDLLLRALKRVSILSSEKS